MMRRSILFLVVLGLSVCLLPAGGGADPSTPRISGDYLEVRTADVWTGPCFANGEVNLAGKEAILAWHVREGGWGQVELADLKVVAVIRSRSTLGDPFAADSQAKSVIVVDERATEEQSRALVDFVRHMSGTLVQDVAWIRQARIDMEVLRESQSASLRAGEFAELRTRPLSHHDMHCGNETVYYPPLTEVSDSVPAFALDHRYSGDGLGATWSDGGKRSAFVGSFVQ